MNLNDFTPEKPYTEEAKRRLKEFLDLKGHSYPADDPKIVELMADFAAEVWLEGYEEGNGEGYDYGYSAGYTMGYEANAQ